MLRMVGHLTVDDVVLADGTTHMRQVGGAPVFAAAGARLAGARPSVITAVSPDLPTEFAGWIAREAIPVVDCGRTTRHIAQWVVYERGGERTFLLHPGSADLYEAAPDAELWVVGHEFGWAHIAPMPVSIQAAWVRRMAEAGLSVALDPHEDSAAGRQEDTLRLLPLLSAFLPSEKEAASLFGGTDMVAAARAFVAAGVETCVIKLGQAGCLVATGDGSWRVPSVAGTCVDATGAGDTFCGGFVAALAHGLGPETAARYGTVAASYAVEGFGVPSPRARSPEDWRQRLARTQISRLAA
jgi:sugar/nucleoside kinase (ribokinase family)